MKTVCVVGHGRSGKDESLSILSSLTGLRNAGTTSLYLTKYVASELGLTEEEAYRDRHESIRNRETWKRIGDEIRGDDPGKLLKEALAVGPLTGGIRDIAEAVVAKDLCDIIVWIQNDRVPPDPTVTFGPEMADIVIQNNGTIPELRERLARLAKFSGLI